MSGVRYRAVVPSMPGGVMLLLSTGLQFPFYASARANARHKKSEKASGDLRADWWGKGNGEWGIGNEGTGLPSFPFPHSPFLIPHQTDPTAISDGPASGVWYSGDSAYRTPPVRGQD